MYSSDVGITAALGDFVIDGLAFRYSNFVRRLYNFCQSLGFERGKILPSEPSVPTKAKGTPLSSSPNISAPSPLIMGG